MTQLDTSIMCARRWDAQYRLESITAPSRSMAWVSGTYEAQVGTGDGGRTTAYVNALSDVASAEDKNKDKSNAARPAVVVQLQLGKDWTIATEYVHPKEGVIDVSASQVVAALVSIKAMLEGLGLSRDAKAGGLVAWTEIVTWVKKRPPNGIYGPYSWCSMFWRNLHYTDCRWDIHICHGKQMSRP